MAISIIKYIERYYETHGHFARFLKKQRSYVSKSVSRGDIVHDGAIYSKRLDLPKPNTRNIKHVRKDKADLLMSKKSPRQRAK